MPITLRVRGVEGMTLGRRNQLLGVILIGLRRVDALYEGSYLHRIVGRSGFIALETHFSSTTYSDPGIFKSPTRVLNSAVVAVDVTGRLML
jgi:hypothetical protein